MRARRVRLTTAGGGGAVLTPEHCGRPCCVYCTRSCSHTNQTCSSTPAETHASALPNLSPPLSHALTHRRTASAPATDSAYARAAGPRSDYPSGRGYTCRCHCQRRAQWSAGVLPLGAGTRVPQVLLVNTRLGGVSGVETAWCHSACRLSRPTMPKRRLAPERDSSDDSDDAPEAGECVENSGTKRAACSCRCLCLAPERSNRDLR